jgi:hypothetical protein
MELHHIQQPNSIQLVIYVSYIVYIVLIFLLLFPQILPQYFPLEPSRSEYERLHHQHILLKQQITIVNKGEEGGTPPEYAFVTFGF